MISKHILRNIVNKYSNPIYKKRDLINKLNTINKIKKNRNTE